MNTDSVSKLKEHPDFEKLHIVRNKEGNVIAVSMKYFAGTYKNKIHCHYNKMFSVLREQGIIDKKEFYGKMVNFPSDKYSDMFITDERCHEPSGERSLKIFVKKSGVELILNTLKDIGLLW